MNGGGEDEGTGQERSHGRYRGFVVQPRRLQAYAGWLMFFANMVMFSAPSRLSWREWTPAWMR